jgi:hypothetical protein
MKRTGEEELLYHLVNFLPLRTTQDCFYSNHEGEATCQGRTILESAAHAGEDK